jgi:hypothetical protein
VWITPLGVAVSVGVIVDIGVVIYVSVRVDLDVMVVDSVSLISDGHFYRLQGKIDVIKIVLLDLSID